MESQSLNPTKIATKWAFINLVAQIIITYAFQLLNMDINSPLKYISYVPMIGCLFLAQKEFRDEQLGGFMTFSQAFSAGFRYAIFSGLLLAVFIYLYYSILSPEILSKTLAVSESALEAKGMTSAEIDKAMGMTRKYGPLFFGFGIAIWYGIGGAVISLVGAAIFKKEKSINDIEKEANFPDSFDQTV
ncbi:DUF4199 domain-containing protein [Mucilaginibacter paludis]|uniref:DUF4199 domain-containing protein n=1 Tax=Mucilaginibacter paludis DSM 18603 TaxID=714943 RepID=H1Y968_9SPHI|nr:DUF4199 domain-containing protein [Mucilaginibacter paludis]EHQ29446.1 hypothetical protein Mucpa_5372 [Mucilaginibacter paludis DSM 18603]